jgi:cytochrome c peroxidase
MPGPLSARRRRAGPGLLLGIGLAAIVAACGDAGLGTTGKLAVVDTAAAAASAGTWRWDLPRHFPVPRVPPDNPMSVQKVELGRFLFHDRRLSGNGTMSCASCHRQDRAFTDGRAVAIGSTGALHPRNAQPLANSAYHPTLTWANKSLTALEQQMQVPLFGTNPVEMGINDANKSEVLERLRSDADYGARFASAFPGETGAVSWQNVAKAIASFQRSLISAGSAYDRHLLTGNAMSDQALRGQRLFFGEKAECFHCHGSFNFNDQVVHAATRVLELPFSNTGLFNIGGTGAFPAGNRGLFELTGLASDMGRFRAPGLRNVEKTAPYMHDGSMATLEEVLDFYAAGGRDITDGPFAGDGRQNPFKSSLVSQIRLDAQEKADLVAFLKALTDDAFLTSPSHANPFR